jgi:hypothetical protein
MIQFRSLLIQLLILYNIEFNFLSKILIIWKIIIYITYYLIILIIINKLKFILDLNSNIKYIEKFNG